MAQRATPEQHPHSALLSSSPQEAMSAQRLSAEIALGSTPRAPAPRRAKTRPRRSHATSRPAPERVTAPRPQPAEISAERLEAERLVAADEARLVAALLEHAGQRVPKQEADQVTTLSDLYSLCAHHDALDFERVQAGDLVLFHNTRDANRDGRNNDWYTHGAIVKEVSEATGSATLSDPLSPSRPIAMSLAYRDVDATEGGLILNTHIRRPEPGDLPYTRYLAGELFAGACRL